jgi:hypothetical protein
MNVEDFVRKKAGTQQTGGRAQMSREQREREQRALQAKVPTNGATTAHRQAGQQNTSAVRQSGGTVIGQAAPQQQPQRRRSNDSRGPAHDMYDTDAESIDTTTHGQSLVPVGHSQPFGQQDAQDDYEDGDSNASYESSSGDEQDDEQQQQHKTYDQIVEQFDIHHMTREEQITFFKNQGLTFPDEGNSYPTTTSGPPDGFPDNWTLDQDALSQRNGHRSSPSPSDRPVSRSNIHPAGQQPNSQGQYVQAPQQNMPKQTVFQQGAKLRKIQNVTAKAAPGGDRPQANIVPQLNPYPPTYRHENHQSVPQAKIAPPQSLPAQLKSVPQYEPQQAYGIAGPEASPVNQHAKSSIPWSIYSKSSARNTQDQSNPSYQAALPTALAARPAAVKPKVEPVIIHEPNPETPPPEPRPESKEPQPGNGDYDLPALYEKTYDELKAEDFDTVPRGKPQVLSDDMLQKPLAERLSHVGDHLDAGDQHKFFGALNTNEWQDAGDWFLDQFSDIIKRTKEARQKKRKLASDFEDQIEKRYRHVAKRQQHVKDALDKMKTQGEGLVPKSPRPSKSPAPKK